MARRKRPLDPATSFADFIEASGNDHINRPDIYPHRPHVVKSTEGHLCTAGRPTYQGLPAIAGSPLQSRHRW